jgi:hypothetical protein
MHPCCDDHADARTFQQGKATFNAAGRPSDGGCERLDHQPPVRVHFESNHASVLEGQECGTQRESTASKLRRHARTNARHVIPRRVPTGPTRALRYAATKSFVDALYLWVPNVPSATSFLIS